jgi:hypothetical protein
MDEAGVLDAGLETGVETEGPGGAVDTGRETPDPQESANRFSKEYRDWIRGLRDTHGKENPNVLKYAKTAGMRP